MKYEEVIEQLERRMWDDAVKRNQKDFMEIVDANAVMVCGGYRCSGREYAEYIADFDCKEYDIKNFEIVAIDDRLVQVHYVIKTEVSEERNKDLAGEFHITSTWMNKDGRWNLVFNMDSRI